MMLISSGALKYTMPKAKRTDLSNSLGFFQKTRFASGHFFGRFTSLRKQNLALRFKTKRSGRSRPNPDDNRLMKDENINYKFLSSNCSFLTRSNNL
jgi:hypothetical protein